MNAYLAVGEVLKPQGISGEVKVRPITNDPMRFEDAKELYLEENGAYSPIQARFVRFDGSAVYLRLQGVEDRNAAETLRGRLLYVDRAHAVDLGEDENFIVDLIGLRGEDSEGNPLGVLTEVMQPGGNDVYVFTDKKNRRETLVPALKSVVLKTDVEGGQMILDAKRLGEVAVVNDL
ncbi:MAG: 16S rRNA processing protein RimM [Clostridia bacterium]|nr:16S rRNA processing protein RimM [Clostridia bacterium]